MKLLILLALAACWFAYAYNRENQWSGTKEFETDDCSGGMSWLYKKLTKKRVPWADECVRHDIDYHAGGTSAQRLAADQTLMHGVADAGYPRWGLAMFVAVRIGGVAWLPTSYRWGFGKPYKMVRS